MKFVTPILAHFNHHKCGSTWIMRVVNQVCQYLGFKHAHFHSPKMFGHDFLKTVGDMNLDFVSYTSADIKYVEDVARFRGFHLIRDPRDIVVSAYFSHRYSHSTEYWPELSEFRKELERLPKDHGLLKNMEFTAKLRIDGCDVNLFDSMMHWNYALPNVMEVKFEDLVANPYKVFIQIFDFLGIVEDTSFTRNSIFRYCMWKMLQKAVRKSPLRWKSYTIPEWVLLCIVNNNEFSRLARGRQEGQENMKSHFRKGVPGDWRNHFNPEHKKFFKENYNGLLVKLGYEKDDKW